MALWLPTDAATAPLCWLRADSLGLSDAASVATWTDSSGNTHTATATAAEQPTFKTGIQNGLPVVRFDGAANKMHVANLGAALSANDNYTIFYLVKPTRFDTYPIILTHPDSGPWDWIQEFSPDGGFYWGQSSGSYRLYSVAAATGAFDMLTLSRSGASTGNFFYNGTEITSFSTNAGGFVAAPTMTGDMILGGYYVGVDAYNFAGDLAEFVVVPATLSTSDRQKTEGYLAWKWGLQASLPVDHPYASAAPTTGNAAAASVSASDAAAASVSASDTAAASVTASDAASASVTAADSLP